MKFLDLFAGIGGFRLGMESAGHECIGFCEIDKFARESYKAIHNTEGEIELHDITTVTDEFVRGIGSVDIICGGFPCQAFSIAGNRRGFEDTRGTLFFEIARFASILRPKYLFLENVKGLLNHQKGDTFETMLRALDELGYDVEWQVLNSKNFGVPQNRERVFIIGHLRGERTRRIFPISEKNEQSDTESKIKVIGNTKNPNGTSHGSKSRVYDSNGLMATLTATDYHEPKQVAIPVLTPNRVEKRQNGRRFKTNGEPMFTLTAQDQHGILLQDKKLKIREATTKGYAEAKVGDSVNIANINSKTKRGRVGNQIANTLLASEQQGVVGSDYRIRRLTPRECWRLQGFPDLAFDKAQAVTSNSQLYKQAGNSVTVNVIAEIAKRFKEDEK
nr:MAG TPA: Cytosine specific methyltransferase [Caudoviricetes sp.]